MKVDSAMIMAAGLGTRMRPLTENKPKPLVEVAGKTLLDHVLDKARDAGISNVVVNVHYLPEQVEAHLAMHASDLGVTISDERDLLMETGGGLVKAECLIAAEPFYCLNSDAIWTEAAEQNGLKRLAQAWDGDRMDGLLLIVPRERAFQHPGKGDFSIDADNRLVRRGQRESAPYVYTGNQLISHRLLQGAPSGPFSTNILWDRAIAAGRLFGLVHEGDWFDIGSPQAIAPTEAALAVHG
jgi:MurNAc alpha-1-phosphate uridylyltransferase